MRIKVIHVNHTFKNLIACTPAATGRVAAATNLIRFIYGDPPAKQNSNKKSYPANTSEGYLRATYPLGVNEQAFCSGFVGVATAFKMHVM